jgi:hypothetical protein
MLHAIRASLLAKAVANLLRCIRGAAFCNYVSKLKRPKLCRRIRMTFCSLVEQGPEILAPALGDATQDGSATTKKCWPTYENTLP